MTWITVETITLLHVAIEAAGQEVRRGVAEAFVTQDKEGEISVTLTGQTKNEEQGEERD